MVVYLSGCGVVVCVCVCGLGWRLRPGEGSSYPLHLREWVRGAGTNVRSPPPSPSWSFAGAVWCMMQQREGVSTGDPGDARHAWSCIGSTWARGLFYAGCPGWHPESPLSGRPSLTWRGARHPAPPRGLGQCRQPSRAQDGLCQVSQAGPVWPET